MSYATRQASSTTATATAAAVAAVEAIEGRKHQHHHKPGHQIAIFVVALGALVLMLRTQGKTLRNDWTPVGIGIKFLLVACIGALLYTPYELFFKGPEAVQKAMRSR